MPQAAIFENLLALGIAEDTVETARQRYKAEPLRPF
jgi:hypothetical protein